MTKEEAEVLKSKFFDSKNPELDTFMTFAEFLKRRGLTLEDIEKAGEKTYKASGGMATLDEATTPSPVSTVSRGNGIALRGIKFTGVR